MDDRGQRAEQLEDVAEPASGVGAAPVAWRDALRDLALRPSKGLGQNFLTDRGVVERIVAAAQVRPGQTVVEVGPGLGVLTRRLLAAVGARGRVVAVELDRRLAAYLREELGSHPALDLVESDILARAPETLAAGDTPYDLVANLPYSVTSAVLRHFLDSPRRPRTMVVMVQREVAERIVARPPAMSVLAVAVQFYGEPAIVFRVGRGAFLPPPKVDSAVLRVALRPAPPLPEDELPAFFRLVNAGFAQRRKQLLNSLAARLPIDKGALATALTTAGVAPDRRAETLAVAEWLALHRALPELARR